MVKEMIRQCIVCGHKWEFLKVENPYRCPKCKDIHWEKGLNQKCEICDKLSLLPIIHHKDGNHKNNIPENKMILCWSCHAHLHNGIKELGTIRFSSQNPILVDKIKLERKNLLKTWSRYGNRE
jgi:predicted RNA-binding Zn-ribbon protein involved in translation (DUF1610 family)